MKINFLIKAVKNLAAWACLAVCVWCAGTALKCWAASSGTETLLFLSGIGIAETAASSNLTESAVTETAAESKPEKSSLNIGKFVSDDGIVPFHSDELPAVAVTPDPQRKSAAVEEITIDGGTQIENFFVRNTSDSDTDLAAELLEDPAVGFKCDGSVEILIYHTHTSEAYSETCADFYYTDMETRTADKTKSVVAAGEALKKELESYGFGVIHDTTVNDELFNGSYSRSWEVIQKNLAQYPTIQVTIDLHRDSMMTESGTKYKPTVTVNGRKAAQIMLLAGCDANGDWGDFPNWRDNLHLILRVQQKAAELYPELARPLDFSDSKYNMNATKGSMLIEVGTEVSTVAEAEYSAKLMGEVLAKTFLEFKNG